MHLACDFPSDDLSIGGFRLLPLHIIIDMSGLQSALLVPVFCCVVFFFPYHCGFLEQFFFFF